MKSDPFPTFSELPLAAVLTSSSSCEVSKLVLQATHAWTRARTPPARRRRR